MPGYLLSCSGLVAPYSAIQILLTLAPALRSLPVGACRMCSRVSCFIRPFARYSQSQLMELGVGRPLLSTIGKITTEEQLLELADCVPQLTADVLLALHDGASVEQVMEQVTAPVAVTEPIDPDDYAAAAARPASLVTTDDETLQAILQRASSAGRCTCTRFSGGSSNGLTAARRGSAEGRAPARPSSRGTE